MPTAGANCSAHHTHHRRHHRHPHTGCERQCRWRGQQHCGGSGACGATMAAEGVAVAADDGAGIAAAISVAIHMYLDERHDKENAILTIKQARKLYSPWSSKIYGTQNRL